MHVRTSMVVIVLFFVLVMRWEGLQEDEEPLDQNYRESGTEG